MQRGVSAKPVALSRGPLDVPMTRSKKKDGERDVDLQVLALIAPATPAPLWPSTGPKTKAGFQPRLKKKFSCAGARADCRMRGAAGGASLAAAGRAPSRDGEVLGANWIDMCYLPRIRLGRPSATDA